MAETASDRTRELGRIGGKNGAKSKLFWFGAVAALLTMVAAVTFVLLSIRNLNSDLEASVQDQQVIMVNGQVSVVTTWLDAMIEQGGRLINADLFRLYASEVDSLGGDLSILWNDSDSDLAVQLPMMRNLLREFAGYSDFVSARIMNKQGESYIATDASIRPLSAAQEKATKSVLATGNSLFQISG